MAKKREEVLELPPSVETEPAWEPVSEPIADTAETLGPADGVSELPGMVIHVNAGVQETASLTIPLGIGPTIDQVAQGLPPYSKREVSIKGMSLRQRRNLMRLQNGLVAAGAILENGTHVSRRCHAIKYILEQLG